MADQLGHRLAHCTWRTAPSPACRTSIWSLAVAASRARKCSHGSGTVGYGGMVVLEVSTRRVATRDERQADLAESLAFARRHLSGEVTLAEQGPGNETAGSGSAGSKTAGSKTARSKTAGSKTARSKTAGSGSAGSKAAGSGSAGSKTAGSGSAGSRRPGAARPEASRPGAIRPGQASTISVTGPSLTSITCMCTPNTPLETWPPSSRSASVNASTSGSCHRARSGSLPGRPAAFAGVGVEGELADYQQWRSCGSARLLVRQNPEMVNLSSEPGSLTRGVRMGHADEHHEAGRGQLGNRYPVHLDARRTGTLDYSSHEKAFCRP